MCAKQGLCSRYILLVFTALGVYVALRHRLEAQELNTFQFGLFCIASDRRSQCFAVKHPDRGC